jgi:hypothetical protein
LALHYSGSSYCRIATRSPNWIGDHFIHRSAWKVYSRNVAYPRSNTYEHPVLGSASPRYYSNFLKIPSRWALRQRYGMPVLDRLDRAGRRTSGKRHSANFAQTACSECRCLRMLRSVGHDGTLEGDSLLLQLLIGDPFGLAQVSPCQVGSCQVDRTQKGLAQVGFGQLGAT